MRGADFASNGKRKGGAGADSVEAAAKVVVEVPDSSAHDVVGVSGALASYAGVA